MAMRVLVGPQTDDLAAVYAVPRRPWLRVNMVSTIDGAATGESGRSGSINNAADKVVFDLLRSQADAILVGAGTVRAEGYHPTDRPIVVISRRAEVPESLRGAPRGAVVMATFEHAPFVQSARAELGDDQVVTAGREAVDLAVLKSTLADRGWGELICEGGPQLLRDLLAAGVVDELCATVVPRVIGGEHPRILQGPPVDLELRLHTLVENGGTLLARWLV